MVEKIEHSDKKYNKLPNMTSTTIIKNMSNDIITALSEILKNTLNEKQATKAIKALTTEEARETLGLLIKDKMPTNIIKVKNKTAKKTKKDPDCPKRGCSSYILFCMDKRSEVKESNPALKGVEVTKELGRIWRENTSDKNKKKYQKKAETDKERYIEEMKNYTPSEEWLLESSNSDSDEKKEKKTKKRSGPKRARSGYIFFCTDMRDKVKSINDGMNAKEVTAELGRMWREEYKLDDQKRRTFDKLAREDKERYEKEKSEWVDDEPSESDDESSDSDAKKNESESESPSFVVSESNSNSKKKKTTKKPSPYINFCKKTRSSLKEENTKWSVKQVQRELERIWESMNTEEQSKY